MKQNVTGEVQEFLQRLLTALDLPLEIRSEEADDSVRFDLEGDGAELLLRRRGEGLDALQHVVNTLFRRQLDDRRIVLDSQGFRRDKDAELRQMAKFLADRAKSSGVPQEIGPLNSYSRRIVHLAVAEDPEVCSESIGDAAMKTVIISLRGR
jgi:spoIIIJ-associated protein